MSDKHVKLWPNQCDVRGLSREREQRVEYRRCLSVCTDLDFISMIFEKAKRN